MVGTVLCRAGAAPWVGRGAWRRRCWRHRAGFTGCARMGRAGIGHEALGESLRVWKPSTRGRVELAGVGRGLGGHCDYVHLFIFSQVIHEHLLTCSRFSLY